MIKKIEYTNKEAIQNDSTIDEKNKVTDADMNEIKDVVNSNADELTSNTELSDSLEIANKKIKII